MREAEKPTQGNVIKGTAEGSWSLVIKTTLPTAPQGLAWRGSIMGSSCSLAVFSLERNSLYLQLHRPAGPVG